MPAFLAKIILSQRIRSVSRIKLVQISCVLTILSVLLVTLSTSIVLVLIGVMLASASSGIGEVTFLTMSASIHDEAHAEEQLGIKGWASGTGAAGIIGALTYYCCTVVFEMTPHATISAAVIFPLFMWMSFRQIARADCGKVLMTDQSSGCRTQSDGFKTATIRSLFFPLLLIYFLYGVILTNGREYGVNMGIIPSVTTHKRGVFVACQASYQVGVFASRTISLPLFPDGIDTWLLAALQSLNAALVLSIAFAFRPLNEAALYIVLLWEGVVGGTGYVMSYHLAKKNTPPEHLDLAISRLSVADCTGIVLAGLVSLYTEPLLSSYYFTI